MATVSIEQRDIYLDIRSFLLGIFPGTENQVVVSAPSSSVPLPRDAMVMAVLFDSDMDYGVTTYNPSLNQASVQNSVNVRFQISFYGTQAESRSRIVDNLWRNYYGTENLINCTPLYVHSRERRPYYNDANQYEDRFILDLALQYNPEVTHAQDFTESAEITIIPVPEGA